MLLEVFSPVMSTDPILARPIAFDQFVRMVQFSLIMAIIIVGYLIIRYLLRSQEVREPIDDTLWMIEDWWYRLWGW